MKEISHWVYRPDDENTEIGLNLYDYIFRQTQAYFRRWEEEDLLLNEQWRPTGILNNPNIKIIYGDYKELTRSESPSRKACASCGALLLDGLLAREPHLLPSTRGSGWS
jgi:hypothetical protein